MTSTLHTDTRSLERAGFLLIIAMYIAHKRKIYDDCAYIYIYIYRYTIYVSHSSPSRKRAPAFSSARVSIFRGKFFRNYPSLLYPRASLCTTAGKTKSCASQRHARVRMGRKGGNLLLCAGVRSPSAHFTRFMLLFSDEFIFNRAFFCFTFLSLSLNFLSRTLPLNL